MEEKNCLKLILVFFVICLVLTIIWCFKEISDLKQEKKDISKELTVLQKKKKELIRDYWKLADLFNQKTLEYEREITEFKKKYETETEIENYTEDLTPREVVERFLEADMKGARSDQEIKKYYILSSGFPTGFAYEGDFVMVIEKYEIIDEYPSENESSYFIKVRYFCKEGIASGFTEGARNIETGEEISIEDMDNGPGLVSFDCDYFYNPLVDSSIIEYDVETQTETITFELIKDKGQWLLNSPSICPRISEQTFEKN